ncbi:hypothetical protein U6010_11015 [Pseudomonas aeruginosa]|uniref:hypothetical protein n=1 Tax=Pseudomonas aeruginosa TaxID=287 RepID=UPI002ADDE136|nr:hypothetical protein [Pseudomonas aeruginosa]MEA0988971.1 hypothetical protein [Pseudomonas aeruginosa]
MRFVNGGLVASAVLLAGCTGTPPVTIEKPVEVKVPVAVACVERLPTKPVFKSDEQLKRGSSYQVVNDLLADRLAREIYEAELEALLSGCVQPVAREPGKGLTP